MKLLIIDDDQRYRNMLVPCLESYGFDVHEADKAADGLRLMESVTFALLIIDGTLPDDNGLNVIKQIRASSNDIPIIFVSAMWNDQKTKDKLLSEFGVAFVESKPIVPGELCKKIVGLIGTPILEMAPEKTDPSKLTAEQKLESVKRAFIFDLPRVIHSIRDQINSAWRFPDAKIDLFELISEVHNLKGTAGMYGHFQLGELMHRIESHLKVVEAGIGSLTSDSWQSIEEALGRVERELV